MMRDLTKPRKDPADKFAQQISLPEEEEVVRPAAPLAAEPDPDNDPDPTDAEEECDSSELLVFLRANKDEFPF